MALDFLCNIAKEYGIKLRYKEEKERLTPVRDVKNDRNFREPATVTQFTKK